MNKYMNAVFSCDTLTRLEIPCIFVLTMVVDKVMQHFLCCINYIFATQGLTSPTNKFATLATLLAEEEDQILTRVLAKGGIAVVDAIPARRNYLGARRHRTLGSSAPPVAVTACEP